KKQGRSAHGRKSPAREIRSAVAHHDCPNAGRTRGGRHQRRGGAGAVLEEDEGKGTEVRPAANPIARGIDPVRKLLDPELRPRGALGIAGFTGKKQIEEDGGETSSAKPGGERPLGGRMAAATAILRDEDEGVRSRCDCQAPGGIPVAVRDRDGALFRQRSSRD